MFQTKSSGKEIDDEAELPLTEVTSAAVYQSARYGPENMKEVERCFARLFLSTDGKKVLAYLQALTFDRALGMDAPDAHLRYLEGQRAMMATILRLIDRGCGF